MAKYLWLKVTLDKYELPLAVAETSEELARLVGVSGNAVRVGRSQEKRGWKRSNDTLKCVLYTRQERTGSGE